ncbi:MAG TPA: hypothetical protein VFS00_27175 [Polyangiaceae bacterium]|nr:hypothetical protein [Polyangiaceae bacterium]
MPHVRLRAATQRLPDDKLLLHHSASLLKHLAETDVPATTRARALVASLLERFGEAAACFEGQLKALYDKHAPDRPAPIEALGARRARALEAACTSPTVEVSEAELLVLDELWVAATMPARWLAHPQGVLGPGEWRVLGPVVEALARDEGAPGEAPDLAPYLPPAEPAPAPEAPPG